MAGPTSRHGLLSRRRLQVRPVADGPVQFLHGQRHPGSVEACPGVATAAATTPRGAPPNGPISGTLPRRPSGWTSRPTPRPLGQPRSGGRPPTPCRVTRSASDRPGGRAPRPPPRARPSRRGSPEITSTSVPPGVCSTALSNRCKSTSCRTSYSTGRGRGVPSTVSSRTAGELLHAHSASVSSTASRRSLARPRPTWAPFEPNRVASRRNGPSAEHRRRPQKPQGIPAARGRPTPATVTRVRGRCSSSTMSLAAPANRSSLSWADMILPSSRPRGTVSWSRPRAS